MNRRFAALQESHQRNSPMTTPPAMPDSKARETGSAAIKAIIFDYDGVLVDSLKVGFDAYQEIASLTNNKGLSSLDDFKKAQARGYMAQLREWGLTTPEQIAKAGKIYQESTKKRHGDAQLAPGLKKTLDALSKKYTLAICSATYRSIITDKMAQHGLLSYFAHITGHEDYDGKTKPHPDIINTCLAKLKIKPHEAVYVGDMVHDIRMGRAADVRTVIIHGNSWNTKEALLGEKPDVIINAFDELVGVLS